MAKGQFTKEEIKLDMDCGEKVLINNFVNNLEMKKYKFTNGQY